MLQGRSEADWIQEIQLNSEKNKFYLAMLSIPLATALIGSTLAALYDLKTTEIPDEIPHSMIVVALLFFGYQSYLIHDYTLLASSIIYGISLLALGFLMYYTGQWGGGDAKLLGAIGFLLPSVQSIQLTFPFPLSYTINLFMVGAVYMVLYSVVLALLNRKIITEFLKNVKSSAQMILVGSIALFVLFSAANLYLAKYVGVSSNLSFAVVSSLVPLFATIGFFLLWKFARTVERVGFRKKIPMSKLRVGDVLDSSRLWEGITEKDLKKIKRSGKKFVVIKEGIRFAPSFVLALIFTLYFGDGILFFLKFLV